MVQGRSKSRQRNISDAEWRIMKILWEEPELTLRQIAERAADTGWSYTTIRTLVTRLAEKGAIAADKTHPANFRYTALLSEQECKRSEVKSLLDRVFDGKKSMLMVSLTEDSGLSEEETKTLLSLIEKMD